MSRLTTSTGIGPINDIDGRMKRQRARLLARNANDLFAPGHDHVFNNLAARQHESDPLGSHAYLGKRLDFGPQPPRKDVSFGGIQKVTQTGAEVAQLQANIRALRA